MAQVADVSRFKAESRGNHPLLDGYGEHFLSRAGCEKMQVARQVALERCNLRPQGWAGVGSMWQGWRHGPGELVGGEVADANRGAVSGAQGGDGGGGDGSVLPGEGNGAASRMADAGSSGGDGGLVNVGELHVMALVNRMAHQRGRQGAARLLRLNHRTGAGSVGRDLRRRCRGALASRSIPVQFLSVSCPMDVNDVGWTTPKLLPGACRGRILNALSGFSSVSTA